MDVTKIAMDVERLHQLECEIDELEKPNNAIVARKYQEVFGPVEKRIERNLTAWLEGLKTA